MNLHSQPNGPKQDYKNPITKAYIEEYDVWMYRYTCYAHLLITAQKSYSMVNFALSNHLLLDVTMILHKPTFTNRPSGTVTFVSG